MSEPLIACREDSTNSGISNEHPFNSETIYDKMHRANFIPIARFMGDIIKTSLLNQNGTQKLPLEQKEMKIIDNLQLDVDPSAIFNTNNMFGKQQISLLVKEAQKCENNKKEIRKFEEKFNIDTADSFINYGSNSNSKNVKSFTDKSNNKF